MRRRIIFNAKQLDRISNIFDNSASIFLGATVLTPLIGDFDRISWLVVISGIVVSGVCWVVSVWVIRKKKY